jgi:HEXXH motif-containing protein
MLTTHRLSRGDLRTLVTGDGRAGVVRRLRAAQLSKHRILLTALMRAVARGCPAEHVTTLAPAYRLLADVESRSDQVVRSLFASPQFGAWASRCMRRLTTPEPAERASAASPLLIDLGQLAVFACAAALRAGHPFELDVPLRNGTVAFPGLGTACPGSSEEWDWARVVLDTHGARVISSASQTRMPYGPGTPAAGDPGWSPLPRLVADSGGIRLAVTLDDRDPFLNCFGVRRTVVTGDQLTEWRRLLVRAWAILAGAHQPAAAMVASLARTMVPLAKPSPTGSASSTAAAAFGAVALSLPDDPLTMAEVLTHESQHAALNAVMDLTLLTGADAGTLSYAPWRDDPRPAGALLQGIFAHFGVAGFWRQQHHRGAPGTEPSRASVEFARWRTVVAQAAADLARDGVLTRDGQELVSAMRAELAAWQYEHVPAAARDYAEDLSIDHRVQWRLRHLRPDPVAIDSLAAAWHSGTAPAVPLPGIGVALRHESPLPGTDRSRSHLLALRYRDPECFRRWVSGAAPPAGEGRPADPADVELALGKYAAAAAGYLRRITTGTDRDAWVGLAIARTRTGPPGVARVLTGWPEVAAALYERLREQHRPDPDQVTRWLA